MQNADVLIFVEDPGAANYVAQLPAALAERSWRTRLLADGHAKSYLLQREVHPEMIRHPAVAHRILTSISPRLLIVGTSENPDTLGLALVAEARSSGIESIGVIDAPMSADYRFRGRSDNPLTYVPDWLLVPDKWTKEVYIALGYPAQRAVICGHPHYDYVRAAKVRLAQEDRNALRQRLLPGIADSQKAIIFATEGSLRLNSQQSVRLPEYTLRGRGTTSGRTEVVLEEFLEAIQFVKPRPYLVLHLHPKDVPDDYAVYLDEFDLISNSSPSGSPFSLIYAADLVVGLTSMLLLEAILLGRLTLSVLPRITEIDNMARIRPGIKNCVVTREELRSALINFTHKSSQMICGHGDDVIPFGSLKRTVEFIEKILKCAKTN